jgi:hypothetical protein
LGCWVCAFSATVVAYAEDRRGEIAADRQFAVSAASYSGFLASKNDWPFFAISGQYFDCSED